MKTSQFVCIKSIRCTHLIIVHLVIALEKPNLLDDALAETCQFHESNCHFIARQMIFIAFS